MGITTNKSNRQTLWLTNYSTVLSNEGVTLFNDCWFIYNRSLKHSSFMRYNQHANDIVLRLKYFKP